MKITWGLACFIVAIDSASKAVGADTQLLFADNMVWLWWVPAASFAMSGIHAFLSS